MGGVTAVGLGFLSGSVLGALFFGGLWLTVRALPGARRPALLVIVGFVGRMVILASGLWLVTAGDVRRILGALFGVLVARTFLVGRVRRALPARRSTARGGSSDNSPRAVVREAAPDAHEGSL